METILKITHEGVKHSMEALNALGIYDPKFTGGEKHFESEEAAQRFIDDVAADYYEDDTERIKANSGKGWLNIDAVRVKRA